MSPAREANPITIVVDGREIEATEGAMLVDAAKHGDVEIPVFCYEPKLGEPVGACRMCLVEIEGIPKLQTACSTPVRDGMVVYTQNERVQRAQNGVVEFLLVNHPLDCPVCDKGGECPLQDISMGWGKGTSRVTDPKRHFEKPIPLSPLIKIDRERCIMCYRCVRFSQEVAEDEQLQILERGARSFIGTHEDRPYVGPFHGNIIELCPVGALTSQAYRFRARPWDNEDAGSICTLCPSQCNVKFTVRDERVVRTLIRDNEEVDDGWLCDKGRFGFQMFTDAERALAPRIRSGGALEETSWEEALDRAAAGLGAAKGAVAALVGGGASNEEGYLIQRMLRGPLGSADVVSSPAPALPIGLRRRLADPALAVGMAEIDHAGAILVAGCDPMHEMPILELRIRKAVRRSGTQLLVAGERPTALDGGAAIGSAGVLEAQRYAPGEAAAFLDGLRAAIASGGDADPIAAALRSAERPVIVWSERMLGTEGATAAAESLLALADQLGLDGAEGGGLFEVPRSANGRGLREAGCAEGTGPGLSDAPAGRSAAEIRAALEGGELRGLILWDVDPIRDFDDPEGWKRAISNAEFTLACSSFDNDSALGADVHLPAETFAEKEGTLTHPDGRLQRVRPGVPHPGAVRPLWQALSELSARLGDETGAGTSGEVFDLLAAEAPFLNGIDVDRIGGFGVRWPELVMDGAADGGESRGTPSAGAASGRGVPAEGTPGPPLGAEAGAPAAESSLGVASGEGGPGHSLGENEIRLGTYRDLWSDFVAERNPALRFLAPSQTLELHPDDAARLGVGRGERVRVSAGERSVIAAVALRERMLAGTGCLIEGVAEQGANALCGARLVTVEAAPAEDEPEAPAHPAGSREAVAWRS